MTGMHIERQRVISEALPLYCIHIAMCHLPERHEELLIAEATLGVDEGQDHENNGSQASKLVLHWESVRHFTHRKVQPIRKEPPSVEQLQRTRADNQFDLTVTVTCAIAALRLGESPCHTLRKNPTLPKIIDIMLTPSPESSATSSRLNCKHHFSRCELLWWAQRQPTTCGTARWRSGAITSLGLATDNKRAAHIADSNSNYCWSDRAQAELSEAHSPSHTRRL